MDLREINEKTWFQGRPTTETTLDYQYVGQGTDQEGPGFYLSDHWEDASKYAAPSGVVLSGHLRIKKLASSEQPADPETIRQMIEWAPDLAGKLTDWDENPEKALRDAVTATCKYNALEKDAFQQVWIDFYKSEPAEYLQNLVSLGYDGHVPTGSWGSQHHLVLYNPKSFVLEDHSPYAESRTQADALQTPIGTRHDYGPSWNGTAQAAAGKKVFTVDQVRDSLKRGGREFEDDDDLQGETQDLADFLNSFGPTIEVFRAVHAQNKKDIDLSKLGEHWTHSEAKALEFARNTLERPWFMISAKIKHNAIDWAQTLFQNVHHPYEEELNIRSYDWKNLKDVKVKPLGGKRGMAGIEDTDFPLYHVSNHPERPTVRTAPASDMMKRAEIDPMGIYLFPKKENINWEGWDQKAYRWDARIKPGARELDLNDKNQMREVLHAAGATPYTVIPQIGDFGALSFYKDRMVDLINNIESHLKHEGRPLGLPHIKSALRTYHEASEKNKDLYAEAALPILKAWQEWIEPCEHKWGALVTLFQNDKALTDFLKKDYDVLDDRNGQTVLYGEPQWIVLNPAVIEWGKREENVRDDKVYQLKKSKGELEEAATPRWDDRVVESIMCWLDNEGCRRDSWTMPSGWKLPKKFRKYDGWVYRGVGLTKEQLDAIKKNKPIDVHDYESWTKDSEVAHRFAFDVSEPYGVVFRFKPAPGQVLADLDAILKDPEFREIAEQINPHQWAYIEQIEHEAEVILGDVPLKNKMIQKIMRLNAGKRRKTKPEGMRECPHCETKIYDDNLEFCPECGKPVEVSVEAAGSQVPRLFAEAVLNSDYSILPEIQYGLVNVKNLTLYRGVKTKTIDFKNKEYSHDGWQMWAKTWALAGKFADPGGYVLHLQYTGQMVDMDRLAKRVKDLYNKNPKAYSGEEFSVSEALGIYNADEKGSVILPPEAYEIFEEEEHKLYLRPLAAVEKKTTASPDSLRREFRDLYESEEFYDDEFMDYYDGEPEKAREWFQMAYDGFTRRLQNWKWGQHGVRAWREITIPKGKKVNLKNLGGSWSYRQEAAHAWYGEGGGKKFVLEAEIPEAAIDRDVTLRNNLVNLDEEEIRTYDHQKIYLYAVLNEAGKRVKEFDPPMESTTGQIGLFGDYMAGKAEAGGFYAWDDQDPDGLYTESPMKDWGQNQRTMPHESTDWPSLKLEAKATDDEKLFRQWSASWGSQDEGLRMALGLDPYGEEPVDPDEIRSWFEKRLRLVRMELKEAKRGSSYAVYRCLKTEPDWLGKLKSGEIKKLGHHWTISRELAPFLCGGNGGRAREGQVVLEALCPADKLGIIEALNPSWSGDWEEFEVGVGQINLVRVWDHAMKKVLWEPPKPQRMAAEIVSSAKAVDVHPTFSAKKVRWPTEDDYEDAWAVMKHVYDMESTDEYEQRDLEDLGEQWRESLHRAKMKTWKMQDAAKKFQVSDHGRRIEGEELDNPIIVAVVRNEYIVLDGSHRFITRFEKGLPTVEALMVPLDWASELTAMDSEMLASHKTITAELEFLTAPALWNGRSEIIKGVKAGAKTYLLKKDLKDFINTYVNIPDPDLKAQIDAAKTDDDIPEAFFRQNPELIYFNDLVFRTYRLTDGLYQTIIEALLARRPLPQKVRVILYAPARDKFYLVKDILQKGEHLLESSVNRDLSTVYHVGSMGGRGNPDFSLEGNGLSVSQDPDAWKRIARLGGYPTFELTKSNPKFYMGERDDQRAIQWGVANGWLRPAKVWRVWSTDEEGEELYSDYYTEKEAQENAYVGEKDAPSRIEVIEGGIGLGPKAVAYWKKAFSSQPMDSMAGGLAPVFYAEAHGYDGVWWEEMLDPEALSAPRGVIFQDRVKTWKVKQISESASDPDFNQYLLESSVTAGTPLTVYHGTSVETGEELHTEPSASYNDDEVVYFSDNEQDTEFFATKYQGKSGVPVILRGELNLKKPYEFKGNPVELDDTEYMWPQDREEVYEALLRNGYDAIITPENYPNGGADIAVLYDDRFTFDAYREFKDGQWSDWKER